MIMPELKKIVHSDPEIMGGEPVFVGTRVPPQILLDWLENGETLDEFLDNYPSVTREQAIAFLDAMGRVTVEQLCETRSL